jgi:putative transposase
MTCYNQIKQLPELRKEYIEYKNIGSQVLQDVVQRLDRAFYRFLTKVNGNKERVGYPRYKSRNRYNSFTLKQKSGWVLEGKYLTIRNIGKFKVRISRLIQGDIKTLTVRKYSSGKWYVCFSCDNVPENKLANSDRVVGIDVGVKSFVVDTEGNNVANPRYLLRARKILKIRQRKLCKRVIGSSRRNGMRILVAKSHEKIRNQRNDFVHKLSTYYVQNYGLICVEDLHINNMVKNKNISEAISDSPWGRFIRYLLYKAEDASRQVIRVPARDTSQKCSACGEKVVKSLAVRIHHCPYCGLKINRDENAARNILRVGQTLQEVTYASTQSVS